MIKLAFMLKKSTHYYPIEPSVMWYCKVPWCVFVVYVLGCVLWYVNVLSDDSNEKKKETVDQYTTDLVFIGACLFILAIMLVWV